MKNLCLFWLSIFIAVFLFPEASFATEIDAVSFHEKVLMTYDFQPHKLTNRERLDKSHELDEFWDFVSNNQSNTVPLLRDELQKRNNPRFFFYDGAKLLLKLSESKPDQQIALDSISMVDLADVQHTEYLRTVHWFARQGLDTTEAAMRLLENPTFKALFPQHVLTLAQNYSFIYLLFPMKEKVFLQKLLKQLKKETDSTAQKTLILALWYTVTKEANSAIITISTDPRQPVEIRKYAENLLDRSPPWTSSFSFTSEEDLRDERRRVMYRISDEALMEFDELTAKLLAK